MIGVVFSLFANLGFTGLGWQFLIPVILALAIFIYGISLGRNRLLGLLLSTYLALVIVRTIPWSLFRVTAPSFGLQIVVLLALVFFIFIFLPGSSLGDGLGLSYKKVKTALIWLFIFAILQLGLFTSVILSFLPEDNLTKVPEFIKKIFASPQGHFIWLALPLLVMILYRKKKK